MHKLFVLASVCLVSAVIAGCSSSVLPTSYSRSESPWETFEDVKAAYDKIEIEQTTVEQLNELGFNPEEIPNVSILSYVDVVSQFSSTFRREDLPEGVQKCMEAKEDCHGYVARIKNIKRKRIGNVPSDLFGFRKKTHVTGWVFEAKIVMVGDVVVYKIWNGTPEIEEFESNRKPLGPIQDMGGAVPMPF